MKLGRLARRGNGWAVVIPVDIRRELQWWPGDDIELHPKDGKLILQNATQRDVPITKRDKRYGYNSDKTA